MTQSVMTQIGNIFHGAGRNESSKGNGTGDDGFGKIMTQSMKSNVENGTKQSISKRENDTQRSDTVNSQQNKLNPGDGNPSKEKISQTEASQTETLQTEVSEINNLEETKGISQKELSAQKKVEEELLELNASIVNAVMGILQISKEEFEAAMENLGLKPEDLLDSANVTKLIMELNHMESPMELLTNEDLCNQVTDINQCFDGMDFDQKLGTTREEVLKFLKEHPQSENLDKNILAAGGTGFTQMQSIINPEAEEPDSTETFTQEESTPEGDSMDKNISIIVEKETVSQGNLTQGENHGKQKRNSQSNQESLESIIENLSLKGQSGGLESIHGMERVETIREIVYQVVEQIKVNIKPELTSMEMQLNPENLGKINLMVASKNGLLTATFTAQNQITKEALESQINTLRDNLNNQGLKVEVIEVTVSNFEFNFNQNQQMNGGQNQSKNQNRKKLDLKEFDESSVNVSEEEQLAAKVLKESGGSVEYTA